MSEAEQHTERRRILDMIVNGQVSADEGDALLAALERTAETATQPGPSSTICPWCAERISSHAMMCPECREPLHSSPTTTGTAGGFAGLSTLDKCLAIITLVLCGLLLLKHGIFPRNIIGTALAALGIAAGILMLKNNLLGWTLGAVWSGLQIIEVLIQGHAINRQLFYVGINFNINGIGLGINLLAIALFVLFMKLKKQREAIAS